MKKFLFMAVLACMFVSCSSDGSREIQIDEVSFPSGDEFKKTSSIFEVVPGKYELAWKKVFDMPQAQDFNVSLKLKLRLKRTVKISDEFLKYHKEDPSWFMEISFNLLDANGEVDADVQDLKIGYKFDNSTNSVDEDEFMDFINFLQSKPGTEKEFELNALGMKTSIEGVDCIETCKNARSISCSVSNDKDFERSVGVIE